MKKILVVLFALVCLVVSAKASTVSLQWTYDLVTNKPCSAAVSTSCIVGFEYGTTVDSGKTLVKIGQFGPAATIQSFSQTFPFGPVVFYMRTVALDSTGATVYSVPSLAPSVTISVGPVSSFTVTITAQ